MVNFLQYLPCLLSLNKLKIISEVRKMPQKNEKRKGIYLSKEITDLALMNVSKTAVPPEIIDKKPEEIGSIQPTKWIEESQL